MEVHDPTAEVIPWWASSGSLYSLNDLLKGYHGVPALGVCLPLIGNLPLYITSSATVSYNIHLGRVRKGV